MLKKVFPTFYSRPILAFVVAFLLLFTIQFVVFVFPSLQQYRYEDLLNLVAAMVFRTLVLETPLVMAFGFRSKHVKSVAGRIIRATAYGCIYLLGIIGF